VLVSWVKKKHYIDRVSLNKDDMAPEFCEIYKLSQNTTNTGWFLSPAVFNMFHDDNRAYPEIKFFHVDGREYIYKAVVDSCPPEYKFDHGSYNYCPFYSQKSGAMKYIELTHRAIGHFLLDVLPAVVFGNEG